VKWIEISKEIELDLTQNGREMSGFEREDVNSHTYGRKIGLGETVVVEVWNECSKRNWIGIRGQIVSGRVDSVGCLKEREDVNSQDRSKREWAVDGIGRERWLLRS
jgi:hypothetical protein